MTTASSRGRALRGKGLGRRMTGSIGSFVVRRARLVLVAALLAVVGFGVLGFGAFGKLKTGGFQDPGAGSTTAQTLTDQRFGGSVGVVLLVHAETGTVDDAPARAAGAEAATRLAAVPGVSDVVSYWQTRNPGLRSKDGHYALVLGSTKSDRDLSSSELASLRSHSRQVDVTVGGSAAIGNDILTRVGKSLRSAEGIAVPIILALLVFAFGSVVAALLPLAIGMIAILGTFAELFVLGSVTNVAIYVINLTTALGLALAIDYGLLMVSRFREELGRGQEPAQAVVRSVQTAGRTIVFSGATVVAALAVLLIFPLYFLRSFGYAGIAVVALAAVGALVVLPALLAVLGRRIDSLRLPFGRRRAARRAAARAAAGPGAGAAGTGSGAWHRIAMAVMRRPVPIALGVVAVLLVLGAPFLGVRFGLPDDRVLPASASSRQVADAIRNDFTARDASALQVVATDAGAPATRAAEIDRYAASLSGLAGVARVDAMTGSYAGGHKLQATGGRATTGAAARASAAQAADRFVAGGATWLRVVPTVEAYSSAGENLVERVRALPAPFGVEVGGPSAQLVDTKAAISDRLPMAVAVIAGATLLLLFLMTGSLVIPIKALILNLLSLSAVYGAMVFIFQDGHLSSLLGFTSTGTIDTSMPVLLSCIAFGLSMDYEVFLLSRIKEEYDRSGDTISSVATGLERSGRIVTTLAALLAIVFIAFATSQVTFLKLFGIGSALAIVVDATLIRALLVPAFMRLAGRANWWAPRPLRLLHDRIGLREDVPRRVAEVTRT